MELSTFAMLYGTASHGTSPSHLSIDQWDAWRLKLQQESCVLLLWSHIRACYQYNTASAPSMLRGCSFSRSLPKRRGGRFTLTASIPGLHSNSWATVRKHRLGNTLSWPDPRVLLPEAPSSCFQCTIWLASRQVPCPTELAKPNLPSLNSTISSQALSNYVGI